MNNPAGAVVPPYLECRDVSLSFSNSKGTFQSHVANSERVLDGLNLTLGVGEIVSLLGPSGCGKSTLLRIVAGLLNPDEGTIFRNGELLNTTAKGFRENLSFVFQEPALLPWRTVWQNTVLPLELRGMLRGRDQVESQERVKHWLRVVGLEESDWKKKPNQLSGGMKMRASIARAMTTRPQLLLMDEPFAALDDVLRSRLNDLILQITEDEKCTVLFVTHNIAEAVYISDRIAVMARGKVSEEIDVEFPVHRTSELRGSASFAELYGKASAALFKNALSHE